MNSFYLLCFSLGLVLSLASILGGGARLHIGHAHVRVHTGHGLSAVNGFTLPAFLCWFGGAGYLLRNYSPYVTPVVLLLAAAAGLLASSLLYVALFKVLIPRERVLSPEDTRMEGVVARISGEIRPDGGTGEILFSQADARRSAAARSQDGTFIPRGTEVVVLRYAKGIAYVAPLDPYH